MSVYTSVETTELEQFLGRYAAGRLRDYRGIEAGIENTNYFVTTDAGEFVLTLFETLLPGDIDFCLGLMAHVSERGLPSARPLPARDGSLRGVLCGKPAALVHRLPGASVERPERWHLAALGTALARLHAAVHDYPDRRPADRGGVWRSDVDARLGEVALDAADRALLETLDRVIEPEACEHLPHGVIHADLFRDNVLFTDSSLSGLIDFYYAHNGPFVYDLAVTVADWCFVPAGRFDAAGARALIDAYTAERTLTDAERALWLPMLEAAGVRFWLSRLHDKCFPKDGDLTHCKDPAAFRRLVEVARAAPAELESVLG
ncbi:MAG: homoserine kinase [Gammaproteobacteria bacterium]